MSKAKKRILFSIAFISGMAIMAMEISASRLLAPFFGTSLFVWTNIIGIVLVALSLGYYYGGILADKKPELNILLKLIFFAGILFLMIPWVIRPIVGIVDISSLFRNASAVIFLSSLVTTALLFSLPMVLLGMVSPFIIKIFSLTENKHMGELSGKVFAVSTIGSILGTFLPTLYFIPFLGTRATINIFAFILILLGSLGFKKSKLGFSSIIALPLMVGVFSQGSIKNTNGIIYEDESAYQYISVMEDKKNTRYLVFNEGGGIQSVYDKENILNGYYYDYYNILPYFINQNNPKKALIIGLAGGTIATQLNYFFKDQIEIEGVEIDKKVIEAAKNYFDLDDSIVKIHNQDGRMFLEHSADKFDLIIVDAYQNELHIVWTLTTREFWELVKGRLSDGGLAAININSNSDSSALLNAITNTMAGVFGNVYISRAQENSSNFMITASDHELDFGLLKNADKDKRLDDLTETYIDNSKKYEYNNENMILTDDKAPIEFMTEAMIIDYFKK